MHNFKKLNIGEEGNKLCSIIYKQTQRFPEEERFGLTYQLIKCGISIPSNMAEGSGRIANHEFRRFLDIALSSAYEMETQMFIDLKLEDLDMESFNDISARCSSLQKKIFASRKSITNSKMNHES